CGDYLTADVRALRDYFPAVHDDGAFKRAFPGLAGLAFARAEVGDRAHVKLGTRRDDYRLARDFAGTRGARGMPRGPRGLPRRRTRFRRSGRRLVRTGGLVFLLPAATHHYPPSSPNHSPPPLPLPPPPPPL